MAESNNVSEEISIDASKEQHESIDEMLARHRQEIKQLQNKETELKKAAAKGSKAEQKAKKKQVEEDISKLSTKLKEKQLKELATQGFSSGNTSNNIAKDETNEKKGEDIETLVRAIAGVAVTEQQQAKQPSKSVKRREKRFKEEAEREQRIKEEQSKLKTKGTDRMLENEKLEKKLKPLGLTIHEIKPDGHCLYRAVENQLGGGYSYQKLREMAASYMREHKPDFLPFFLSETEGDSSSDSVEERFEKYCKEVESTAAWGGQLELGALTHCLKKHIMVFSGSFPDVEMGKEYKSGNNENDSVRLSYHRHAFGLGEHYNSVVLLPNNIAG